MYDKNLGALFTVSGSYARAAASKYHFYLMGSNNSIYATSISGVVYIYGMAGDVHYARVSKEFWDSDKGVAYNSGGYLYILGAPSDLVFVTTTSTVYMLRPVTRTFTSTETATVYGVPAYSSIALFIALIVLVAGIYYFLKKK
jgi:alpha-ketoglutarate-dependent taurine dioxygenase